MKVKYIGPDMIGIIRGKIYDVITIEKHWYRIMTEFDEDYLFPPECFTITSYESVPEDLYPEYRK